MCLTVRTVRIEEYEAVVSRRTIARVSTRGGRRYHEKE